MSQREFFEGTISEAIEAVKVDNLPLTRINIERRKPATTWAMRSAAKDHLPQSSMILELPPIPFLGNADPYKTSFISPEYFVQKLSSSTQSLYITTGATPNRLTLNNYTACNRRTKFFHILRCSSASAIPPRLNSKIVIIPNSRSRTPRTPTTPTGAPPFTARPKRDTQRRRTPPIRAPSPRSRYT
jgi:hypothetical protein